MRLLKPLLILISLAIPFTGFSQDRGIPVYSDYLTDNLYLLHPSMAGASLRNQVRLTARQQWFDVDDAPALQTLSANGRVSENIGVGGILYNDSNGRFSQQGAYATFAYHLMFSRDKVDLNQLSFGINAGILQEGLDESDLIGPSQPPDPQISGANLTDTYFNFDFGVSYYFRNFFAHATLKNLIPQQRDIFSEDFQLDNQRQYLVPSVTLFLLMILNGCLNHLYYLFIKIKQLNHHWILTLRLIEQWILAASGAVFLIAVVLMVLNIPEMELQLTTKNFNI